MSSWGCVLWGCPKLKTCAVVADMSKLSANGGEFPRLLHRVPLLPDPPCPRPPQMPAHIALPALVLDAVTVTTETHNALRSVLSDKVAVTVKLWFGGFRILCPLDCRAESCDGVSVHAGTLKLETMADTSRQRNVLRVRDQRQKQGRS